MACQAPGTDALHITSSSQPKLLMLWRFLGLGHIAS